MVAGRKIRATSETGLARAVATKTGADATVEVLSPTWAVAQIVQVWWDAVEFSGCEWAACIVPITHTRATESTHTALTNVPRFAATLSMPLPRFLLILGAWPLDDCTLRWSSAEIRCTKNEPFTCTPEPGLQAPPSD